MGQAMTLIERATVTATEKAHQHAIYEIGKALGRAAGTMSVVGDATAKGAFREGFEAGMDEVKRAFGGRK
jgi:hypothetical protein